MWKILVSEEQNMNLIYIGTDTWRADFLGCYGNTTIKTPSIDRLAAEGVSFTNTYAEALPTIPMRRAVFTGKSTLPFEPVPMGKCFPGRHSAPQDGWGPLHREDVVFADVLAPTASQTHLIADCY
jgi:arylsulfatase A-like enzyme